jgi:hypothetical protein
MPLRDLTLTLGGPHARDDRGARGEPVERQGPQPLRSEVPAADLRVPAGAAIPPPCAPLPASALAAVALSEPAIAQALDRWIRHGNVAPAVAEPVVSALMACRGDPNGYLSLRGPGLVEFPRPLLRLRALTSLALNDNAIERLPQEIGDSEDRVAMGFNPMQAALLTSRTAAGELSPAQFWRLTQASLPSASAVAGQASGAHPDGAHPDGTGSSRDSADPAAAFHAAATAARAGQRLQRGAER